MTAIAIYLVCAYALIRGIKNPFIWTLTYIWLDFFRPQDIAPKSFGETNIFLLFGALGIIGLAYKGRQRLFKLDAVSALLLFLAAWVTYTTGTAISPDSAFRKWDSSIKTILFYALATNLLSTKTDSVQILWASIAGACAHLIPVGIKTILSGGGYTSQLSQLSSNAFLAESSTVSVIAICFLPVLISSTYRPCISSGGSFRRIFPYTLILLFLSAAFGTHARAGIASLFTILIIYFLASTKKLSYVLTGGAVSFLLLFFLHDSEWFSRASTIGNLSADTSASGRFEVWKWTWEFVKNNPLGGGFNVYEINEIILREENSLVPYTRLGVAFHSIYFEVLGEHGFPGFFLYFGAILLSFLRLYTTTTQFFRIHGQNAVYSIEFSMLALTCSLLVGSAFVGIAFSPYLFCFIAVICGLTRTPIDHHLFINKVH
jgi:putative inorganic carbon (HCO3(-)) transporter